MKIATIVILAFITLGACKSKGQDNNGAQSNAPFGDVTAKQAQDLKAANADIIFIDVRTPGEISSGKIEGALEIDFRQNTFNQKIDALDKDKEYVVYCRSGGRSKEAQDYMKESGFKNAKNMLGGYTSWAK